MSQSIALGWHFALPLIAPVLPVGLARSLATAYRGDAEAAPFKAAVAAFQKATDLVADGDLGPKSWARFSAGAAAALVGQKTAALLGHSAAEVKASAPAFSGQGPALQNYVRIGGVPVPLPASLKIRVDHSKAPLVGRKGCVARNALVLHWGGLNAVGCYNVLKGRNLGTHLIGECELGADGVLTVLQTCDLADTAFHAGEMNRYAVGFDVARSPQVVHAGKYPGARIVPNPAPRGERQVVALPEGYGAVIRPFIAWVAQVFGIEYRYQGHQVIDPEPDGTVVHPERIRGVVGHHNVDRGKWDVAPWHEDLWPAAGEIYDFAPAASAADAAGKGQPEGKKAPAARSAAKAPPRALAKPSAPAPELAETAPVSPEAEAAPAASEDAAPGSDEGAAPVAGEAAAEQVGASE